MLKYEQQISKVTEKVKKTKTKQKKTTQTIQPQQNIPFKMNVLYCRAVYVSETCIHLRMESLEA